MSDLTDDIKKFNKNINNLKKEIKITNNSNRFELQYYLDQFEYNFNEFNSNKIIRELPILRRQKLNDLILYHDKIKKKLAESNISSSNITINIPIFKNNIANAYFKSIYSIINIPDFSKLLNILNIEIINKIFYPKYIISSGNNYQTIQINPLKKNYYKQNIDSELLTDLKRDQPKNLLAKKIRESTHFLNIVGNIYDNKNYNKNDIDLKISIFYSNLVNYIAEKLYYNQNLIYETNNNVIIKNINIIFNNNSNYSKLALLIFKYLIKEENNDSKSLNNFFKEKIINTIKDTSDLLIVKNFLSGHFNNKKVKNIPLNKIYENRRNELIRSIPKTEKDRKITKFILSNYLNYSVIDIETNKQKILQKYDKFNSVFPSLKVLIDNITKIEYNKKKKKFEIFFSNIINYNKNFIYYNIKRLLNRINNFKIEGDSKYIISFKKIYIIFSLELLRQINNNIESIVMKNSNLYHLEKLISSYFNLRVESAKLNIYTYSKYNNNKNDDENIDISINTINKDNYKNTDFIENMILFTYQNLERTQMKDSIRKHLKSLFDFKNLFDDLFINIDNYDLLSKLIINNRVTFEYNENIRNYQTKIGKLEEEEKNMLIDTHYNYVDSDYLNSLKELNFLSSADILQYNKNNISLEELIFIIQKNKLIKFINNIIKEILDVDKIKKKFNDYVLFFNNKISLIYAFAFNKKLNINSIYNINYNISKEKIISDIINNKEFIKRIQKVLLDFIKEYIFYKSISSEQDEKTIESYILEKILSAKIYLNLNKKDINIINQQRYNIT
tara:strand:+ start:2662 stop:5022 length:2361 start_codon:yes stop_codon:yes gene_type:complete